jgi:SHAQKYF class myb-like DNA-binding protein
VEPASEVEFCTYDTKEDVGGKVVITIDDDDSERKDDIRKKRYGVGQWNEEEKSAFIAGLQKHGRNWVKVSAMVKTRSLDQIRSHAQQGRKKAAKKRLQDEKGALSQVGRSHYTPREGLHNCTLSQVEGCAGDGAEAGFQKDKVVIRVCSHAMLMCVRER